MIMKLRILAYSLVIFFAACKKEIPEPPTSSSSNGFSGPTYSEYNITFFTSITTQGPIGVSCGSDAGSITYAMNYNPGCHAFGCANLVVPPGTYTWVASGASMSWQGTVTTGSSQCITIQVQ